MTAKNVTVLPETGPGLEWLYEAREVWKAIVNDFITLCREHSPLLYQGSTAVFLSEYRAKELVAKRGFSEHLASKGVRHLIALGYLIPVPMPLILQLRGTIQLSRSGDGGLYAPYYILAIPKIGKNDLAIMGQRLSELDWVLPFPHVDQLARMVSDPRGFSLIAFTQFLEHRRTKDNRGWREVPDVLMLDEFKS